MAKNGKDVLSFDDLKGRQVKRPGYVAYVSIRAADVMSVEDMPVDNPDAGIGKDEPLKINVGSVVQIRNVPKAIKVDVMREEVLRRVSRATRRWFWEFWKTGFITFPWIDPNMKRSI